MRTLTPSISTVFSSLSVLLILICGCGVSRISTEKAGISVSPPGVTLGEVWQLESVPLSFEILNSGIVPVDLEVKKTCNSCTDVEIDGTRLNPGVERLLNCKLRRSAPGSFDVRLSIFALSNDVRVATVQIAIKGYAKKAYQIQGNWEGDEPTTIDESIDLPDVPNSKRPDLLLSIIGKRPNDPIIDDLISGTKTAQIISPVFSLVDAVPSKVGEKGDNFLQLDLRLRINEDVGEGESVSALGIQIDEELKFPVKVSFRTLGRIWAEKESVSFGELRKPETRRVVLNFQPGLDVWKDVEVASTSPEAWLKSVKLSDVRSDGQSVSLNVGIDPGAAPSPSERLATKSDRPAGKNDSFFHFELLLREKGASGEKAPTTRVTCYGMIL